MSAVDWTRAKAIFGDAVDVAPAEREHLIEVGCGGDDQLASAVRRLLRAHAADVKATGSDAKERPVAPADANPHLLPASIGPYRLGEIVGEGGFGVVVRAEQQAPLTRTVAIKIFKPGRDGAEILRRFDVERDALARMSHPGIASVLDAGRLDDGRPYVVMEFVDGVPITRALQDRDPSPDLRARLRLIVDVARAIHHAHQRAVIHRDIKPSNILVTDGSEAGDGVDELRPRVIDFGIARATGPGDQPGDTRSGDLLGTPRYMSPEQLAGDAGGDVRSDVHALGVVLCEVLTGRVPRDPRTLGLSGDREVPAEAPSRLLLGAETDGRSTPAIATGRRLPRDLDRIVLRAVAWDPDDRYESAAAFADDIDRFLRGEPVVAVGPSTIYRVRRFVGRHALASGLAAAAVLAIGAGGTAAMIARAAAVDARDLAASEATRATFISDFLLEDMLAAADPDVGQGSAITVAEMLDAAARTAPLRFAERPELLADVAMRIGTAYERIGQPVEAVDMLEIAADAEARIAPADDERRLAIAVELAAALSQHPQRHREGVDRAMPLHEETVARLGRDHDLARRTWIETNIAGEHEPAAAVDILERMWLDLLDAGRGDEELALRAAERLAIAYAEVERHSERIGILEDLADRTERRLGVAHTRSITARYRLGRALVEHGDPVAGESMVDLAHDRATDAWPPASPNLIGMRNELVNVKLRLERHDDAVRIARLAEEGAITLGGRDSIRHGLARHNLGRAMVEAGRFAEAAQVLEAVLPSRLDHWGEEHRAVALTRWQLTIALAGAERWEDAVESADAALAILRPQATARADCIDAKVRAHRALGRPADARRVLDAALDEAEERGHTALAERLRAIASRDT